MPGSKFDDSNLTWRQLEGLDDLWFYVYNVDRKNGIVDVIFKFAANSRVPLHRHKTPYVTVVLQGDLKFWRPNGDFKETRPIGSYVTGLANGEPHTEGPGDIDAIVLFSNRNVEDAIYEFIDDDGNPTLTLRIADFEEQLKLQGAAKWQKAA